MVHTLTYDGTDMVVGEEIENRFSFAAAFDKAVVFEQGNVDELKNTLQSLCDNPDMVQGYKNNASDYICEKYNWDDIVEQTIAVYREIQ